MGTSACDAIWLDGSNGSDLAQNEECKLEDDSCDFRAKRWGVRSTVRIRCAHLELEMRLGR